MIRVICKDMFFLSQKASNATKEDICVADDLLDTLRSNADHCVGIAANMIGIKKRIIAFAIGGGQYFEMFNPEIIKTALPYDTTEGCLSLMGTRPTKRFKTIVVRYQNRQFQTHTQTFNGYIAQIIQHEIDHTNGILI